MSVRRGARIGHCLYAALVMAIALLVQRLVWPYIQPSPFLFLTLAVVVAGLHGEWAPGVLATGIGAISVAILFLPDAGAGLTGRDAFTLTLFVLGGFLVTAINVSRRRGDDAAIENEQWLRTTLHSIGDGVIATDRDGRVRFLNGVAEALTGWRSHEAAGRPVSDVFQVKGDRTRTLVGRDGREHVIEDRGAPIHDDEGQLAGVALVFHDATARARDDLQRALLAEVTDVLIGSLEVESTLPAAVRLLVPRAADRVCIHTRRDDGSLEMMAVAGPDGAAQVSRGVLEAVAVTGGAELHAAAIAVSLTARGKSLGVLELALAGRGRQFGPGDLELAKELARRIAGAIDSALLYREAQQAIRLRDEFLAIASHELRTPLTTLQLQLDSLALSVKRLPPETAARIERKINSSSRQSARLAGLVDSLLDVSRITAGRLALHPEPMDLVAVARDIADRFHDQAGAAACEVRLSAAEQHIEVHWDRLRIEQVLSNLLANAIKYGAGHPVEIALDRLDDGRARVVVRDRGIGIADADLERVFGRFERAVSARNYGGLGLGLFIARQIVEAHGGEIRAVRTSGGSTELMVVMPTEVAVARAA